MSDEVTDPAAEAAFEVEVAELIATLEADLEEAAEAAIDTWPLAAAVGTLTLSNVVANKFLPSWAYVPWNCGVAATLVAIATKGDRLSMDDIGLAARRVPDGVRLGSAVSGALVGVYLSGLAVPTTRDLFKDDRADIGIGSLLWQTCVMVPAGTVFMEEVAFRGVLPAMLRNRLPGNAVRRGPGILRSRSFRADVAAATLFGLWHVLPSWNVNEVNPVFRDHLPGSLGRAAAISAGVVGTAAAGMAWSWLRNRSGSIAAPAVVHTATNSLGYIISWIVQRA